jgi:hypothetical protein
LLLQKHPATRSQTINAFVCCGATFLKPPKPSDNLLRSKRAAPIIFELRRNRRPDEEGIKTIRMLFHQLRWWAGIVDLMKKGFTG